MSQSRKKRTVNFLSYSPKVIARRFNLRSQCSSQVWSRLCHKTWQQWTPTEVPFSKRMSMKIPAKRLSTASKQAACLGWEKVPKQTNYSACTRKTTRAISLIVDWARLSQLSQSKWSDESTASNVSQTFLKLLLPHEHRYTSNWSSSFDFMIKLFLTRRLLFFALWINIIASTYSFKSLTSHIKSYFLFQRISR